jgi:hypothetical protein
MARKDDILKFFLSHEILEKDFNLTLSELPNSVREALKSDIPVVKAIAIIVDGLERTPTVTDNDLRNSVLQFLNTAI